MEDLATLPKGDNETIEQDGKFPIMLEPGLTNTLIIDRSKEYRGIWKKWADKQIGALETYTKMFLSQYVGPLKSKSTVVLSIASGIIETLTARLNKGIWGRDKLVDVMSLTPGTSKEQTQLVEDFINQELIYVSRGTKKGKSLIKGCLIEGIGAWQEYWKVTREVRSNPVYDPATGAFLGEGEPVETDYQCWDWREKDPLSICFDPSSPDTMAVSPWVGVRTSMSLADLKVWEAQGTPEHPTITNVDQIATITPSSITNVDDWEAKRKGGAGSLNKFEYGQHKEYTVDEWRGTIVWEVDQEGVDEKGNALPKKVMSEDFHWIIVEEKVLILFEKNDLQPKRKAVGSFPVIIDPRKPMGKSALHDVVGIQQMINMFAGKQSDLVEQAANRPTYYDKRSGMSGRTAFQRTQGLIAVNDVNGIKEGTVDTSAIQVNQAFLQFLIDFARNLTAATEQAQGLQGAGTATEFAGLMQLVGTRFEELADNIIQFFCVPLGQGCLDFYQQFGIDGQMVVRRSSIDGESYPITRQMLQGRWQIVPSGFNAQANKEARTKNAIEMMRVMMELAQAAMANPALTQGQLPNLKEAFDAVMSMMDQRNTQNMWVEMPPPPMMMPPPAAVGGEGAGPAAPPPTDTVSPEAMV